MIFFQISEQLKSLSDLLLLLNDKQYIHKNEFLGNASIGGHSRHIIELLKCATNGYNTGVVDYLNRKRNLQIETDKSFAIKEISILVDQIVQSDKPLYLVSECSEESLVKYVSTTYFREIVYNAEHTIHHLALIRVGLREMKLEIVGEDFGMAYSTIKYLASQGNKQN